MGALCEAEIHRASESIRKQQSTDYEILVITPAAEFGTVADEYERFRTSVELGPDLEQTCDWLRTWLQSQAMQTQNTINGAMAQMAADRSASWDRRQAIINDTNAYTSGVMHDMMASNAASHERVAGMQSEMIREVNTYAGYGGPVEASTRWDHVYQGAPESYPGQDTYVGVEGGWLEPGVDFVELPKI